MAKTCLESAVVIDADAPSAFETYTNGLEVAEMLDALNLELKGIKTTNAKEWQRKYGRKFGHKEEKQ